MAHDTQTQHPGRCSRGIGASCIMLAFQVKKVEMACLCFRCAAGAHPSSESVGRGKGCPGSVCSTSQACLAGCCPLRSTLQNAVKFQDFTSASKQVAVPMSLAVASRFRPGRREEGRRSIWGSMVCLPGAGHWHPLLCSASIVEGGREVQGPAPKWF